MSTNKTPARKLTRAERKQIDAAIARARRQDKRKKSAQDSIPFQRMYPDGVCRVTDNYYTKTVQFQDINYQLNQNEDKTAIFDGWCDFLNYFDSSIRFQLSFINLSATQDTYARRIAIPLQGDCFDKLRTEYTGMLQSQLARGNNGLIKTKYLTLGVEADSLKAAKPRLERIETDILNNFRRLGVQAESLNGMERLRLLHGMLHMDEPQPFRFSWDWLAPSGLSVKDFIAPSAFEFKTGSSFDVGSKTGCVSFLQILAPELNDRMLADFLDMESSLIVSMHVQSVDQVKAIKTIKRKITDLQKMTIEEQKKAVRSGYDMDIIPSDLATYGTEAKKLLQELQSRNLQSYEYEAEVPYTWYICHVELENFNLSHVPVHIMSHDQLSMYAVYMSVLGNRPDLFPGSPYVNRYYHTQYEKYEIPPEALADEQFAAIIKEAEKYLGYPYIWGGSSPATSFDCSGFVSYVYNNCGLHWSFGRLGAEGLRGMCTYVSPESARPGDLIFFEKTYDTAGASHVGIYVGNNRMLHCGDPIHYASIDTSYWRSHFLQFGRLP